MDILNSALLEVDENHSTENLEEITDGNQDKFRNHNELLLAEIGDMMRQMSRMIKKRKVRMDSTWHSNNLWIAGLLPNFYW